MRKHGPPSEYRTDRELAYLRALLTILQRTNNNNSNNRNDRERHECSSHCRMVASPISSIHYVCCSGSGNVHVCGVDRCTAATILIPGARICRLTGQRFEYTAYQLDGRSVELAPSLSAQPAVARRARPSPLKMEASTHALETLHREIRALLSRVMHQTRPRHTTEEHFEAETKLVSFIAKTWLPVSKGAEAEAKQKKQKGDSAAAAAAGGKRPRKYTLPVHVLASLCDYHRRVLGEESHPISIREGCDALQLKVALFTEGSRTYQNYVSNTTNAASSSASSSNALSNPLLAHK